VHEPSRPSLSKRSTSNSEAAFDAFDEDAQADDGAPLSSEENADRVDEHGHVAISTGYSTATGKWFSLFAGVVAIALLVGFFAVNHAKHNEEAAFREEATQRARQPPVVELVRASSGSAVQTLTLPGETQGWHTSTIYARVTGYVAKWLVDIGDLVKKDQVIAVIDTPDLDAELQAAKAQLNASTAEVNVKESDADFAETTHLRWKTSPQGSVSAQEREDKKARYEASVAQLNVARARVELDRAHVDRLTHLAHFKEVTAPFDGVITERHIDIGDLVTAGGAHNPALYRIVQSNPIRVFADVPQAARVDLNVGTLARVNAAELPGLTFEGKVARTSESQDSQARTLRVEIDLSNNSRALVPGMYVQVIFDLPPKSSLRIPAGALIFRGTGVQVAVLSADDRVIFQNVTIARDEGKFVEIASGIREGDRVVVNLSNQVAENEKVSGKELSEDSTKASNSKSQ
jgi:RND family efflux transporter MFP subunit